MGKLTDNPTSNPFLKIESFVYNFQLSLLRKFENKQMSFTKLKTFVKA